MLSLVRVCIAHTDRREIFFIRPVSSKVFAKTSNKTDMST